MCGRYSAAGTLSKLAKLIDFIIRTVPFPPGSCWQTTRTSIQTLDVFEFTDE
jgi:hypothetical protein